METLKTLGEKAKAAAFVIANTDTDKKNQAIIKIADYIIEKKEDIIKANKVDLVNAEKNNMRSSMVDRLRLDEKRILEIADGVRKVAQLPDPIGEVTSMVKRPNGLLIGKKRVPLGTIGIIYESRPNVTADAAVLCLKSGNSCILRGGSEAINTNIAIVDIMRDAIGSVGLCEDAIALIKDTSRETATAFMKLSSYLDVLIPRGGAGLIRAVVENATVPVIETAAGNCHIYVDSFADFNMAENIIMNAKLQRPSVCNAVESLLVHKDIAEQFVPQIVAKLMENNVEIRGCERTRLICPDVTSAKESDWGEEYNDYIISLKIIDDISSAIHHINKYNTKHSESIVTSSYENAQKFLQEVDAAAVYVNASTRFTDGFEFGFGAEIGISTQKMHARGPMGLMELTSYKYIIYGDGQVR